MAAGDKPQNEDKQQKQQKQQKEEENKPEKPDPKVLEESIKGLNEKIDACKATIEDVRTKLDKIQEKRQKGSGVLQKAQAELEKLKSAHQKLNGERRKLIGELRSAKEKRTAAREENDKMMKTLKEVDLPPPPKGEGKDKQKGPRFSAEVVEKKINELEYYLATNALNLKQEKSVIAEIKQLNASKRVIGDFDGVRERKEEADNKVKELAAKLDEGKGAVEAAKAKEDAQYQKVTELRNKDRSSNESKALIETRNKARKEIGDHIGTIKSLRDEFRKKENEWRAYMNEKRKEAQKRYKEEEAKRREEERIRKLQEDEEKEESMHADKFATIQQLTVYLQGLQKANPVPKRGKGQKAKAKAKQAKEQPKDDQAKGEEPKAEKPKADKPKADKPKPSNDGLGEMIGKGANKIDQDVFGTKASKPKRKQKQNNQKAKRKQGMVHDINFIVEFETLKLDAPLTAEDIPKTLKALKQKKEELEKDKEDKRAKRLAKLATLQAQQEGGEKEAKGEAQEKAEDAPKESDQKAEAVEASA